MQNKDQKKFTNHNFNIEKDYDYFVKNSFYSLLTTYFSFFFFIIYSFIISKIISSQDWGFLILANSLILIINLFLTFLPPSLSTALNYYIPKFYISKDEIKLKFYIKYSILIKFFFSFIIFLTVLTIFFYFQDLFEVYLKSHSSLIVILSPLIIILSLDEIFASILKGINKFNIIFFNMLIANILKISLIIFFFLTFNSILSIEMIAFLNLISAFFALILKWIFILFFYLKIKCKLKKKIITIKKFLIEITKIGFILKSAQFFSEIWIQLQNQLIGIFSTPKMVTGLNIALNYSKISSNITTSFTTPLTISFSRFIVKNSKEIEIFYNIFLKISILILIFITGILYFLTDFFLDFIFGSSYLIYSDLLKVILFTIIFLGLGTPFESFMLASKKVKIILLYRIITFLLRFPLFFFLLLNFGIFISYIGLIFSHFFISIFSIILIKKFGGINIKLKKIVYLYTLFFISLGTVIILDNLFLYNLNYLIFNLFNLSIFYKFKFLEIITFIFLFFFQIFLFRIITKKDIYFISLYFKNNYKMNITSKIILKIILKFVRN